MWDIDLLSALLQDPARSVTPASFDQRQAQTTDGRPAENIENDCGPAAVALVIYWLTRFLLLVDEVKDIIWAALGRTPETAGVTSEYDLMTVLQERAGVSCTRHVVTSRGQCMSVMRDALAQGHLLVALRCGVTQGKRPFHWATVYGGTGPDLNHTTTVRWFQSYGGSFQESTNDDFWSWCAPYPVAGQAVLFSVDAPQRV